MIHDKYSNIQNRSKRWQLRNRKYWLAYCKKRNTTRKNNPLLWEAKLVIDRAYQRRKNKEARIKLIFAMGNKCIRCGFSDIRALQIDHVHGGGSQERKKLSHFSAWRNFDLIIQGYKIGKYQLLCANCNWIKRTEKHENWYAGRSLSSH